jgi:O-methyltransferase
VDLRGRFFEWYSQAAPPRALRLLSLPLNQQLKTIDWFRYENARMIETAFGFVANNGVPGDYTEFGVLQGGTFVQAWRASRRWSLPLRLHAFDSFAGLPPVTGVDAGGQFHEGQYSAPRTAFEQNLVRHKVDRGRVTVTEGFFADTLLPERAASIGLQSVAVAWVDCDLYESTVPVLGFISELLSDGAVLCFDDWFCYKGRSDRGEQRACAEWLERETSLSLTPYHKFHWAGNSFIVNRR